MEQVIKQIEEEIKNEEYININNLKEYNSYQILVCIWLQETIQEFVQKHAKKYRELVEKWYNKKDIFVILDRLKKID